MKLTDFRISCFAEGHHYSWMCITEFVIEKLAIVTSFNLTDNGAGVQPCCLPVHTCCLLNGVGSICYQNKLSKNDPRDCELSSYVGNEKP